VFGLENPHSLNHGRRQTQLGQRLTATLSNNTHIEPGTHSEHLQTCERRNVSWKNVVNRLKGTGYAPRILAYTKPRTYINLVVRETAINRNKKSPCWP